MNLASQLKEMYDKFRKRFYNEYTVAEYFRTKGVQIGDNCRILIHNFGSEPYLVKIGNNCVIAPGVSFLTHDGSASLFRKEIPDLNVFGKIEIKDNCFIGARAILLYNVTIGPNAIVGAGAVVTKDVPPNTVVAGMPAKVVCSLDEYKQKCVDRWKKLELQGPRSTWEKQLKEYFWGEGKVK